MITDGEVKPDRYKVLDRRTRDNGFFQADGFMKPHRDSSELSDSWIELIVSQLIGKPEFKCILIHLDSDRIQRFEV